MKLLVENIENSDISLLTEGEGSEKSYKIKGIFLQSEIKNNNGRIYPRLVLEREIDNYIREKISTRRAMGELEHPNTPNINLDRVSHIVESLEWKGNDVHGIARVIDTPCGRIVKTMLKEGVKLGISSRSLGTVNHSGIVDDNLKVCALDLVSSPSAPSAFVENLMESKEYIIQGDRILEVAVNDFKRKLDKHGSKVLVEGLKEFFESLK